MIAPDTTPGPTYCPNASRYVCQCRHCERQFSAKYPLAKWCSDQCRNEAYVERRRERRRLARQKKCEACHGEFQASRKDAKYCSAKCKQKGYRERVVTDTGCGKSAATRSRNG